MSPDVCGRYTLTRPDDLLAALGVEAPSGLAPRYNVAPTQEVPVVRIRRPGEAREAALLRWGLVPFWVGDPAGAPRRINARAEGAAEKPAFREALRRRRCLVPTDGFFEWQRIGRVRQPFHLRRRDGGVLPLAGLWERWHRGGVRLETFAILTTPANALVAPLHDRMPAILPAALHELWLDPTVEDPEVVQPLLSPYAGSDLEAVPVSRAVNQVANDRPECLERVALQPSLPGC